MRFLTRLSTRSLLQYRPEAGRPFRSEGAGQVRPRTCPAKRELDRRNEVTKWSGKSCSGSPLTELDGETRLPMVTKIMKWVCVTALLLAVTWRPAENHQMQLDFVVCGGALVGVLALFFIKHEIETHPDPTPRGESL